MKREQNKVSIHLSVQKWLLDLARKESINISDFLERALMKRLGIKDYDAF